MDAIRLEEADLRRLEELVQIDLQMDVALFWPGRVQALIDEVRTLRELNREQGRQLRDIMEGKTIER